MMWLAMILAIAMFVFMILTIECNHVLGRALFAILTVILSYISIVIAYEYSTIDPIEVYRGNTELDIIYRNDTPIDSIVVWKQQ